MQQWFPYQSDQSIHCVGVAGSGVKRLARVFAQAGWTVTGSDDSFGASLPEWEAIALLPVDQILPPSTGHVIRSLAIDQSHPQLLQARRRQLPVTSYPQVLADLTRQFPSIAVAGSHGKSSTCGLIDWFLRETPPTTIRLSGTDLCRDDALSKSIVLPERFLIEACEFQQSFLALRPTTAVVLNLDHDHIDCYPTHADAIRTVGEFLKRVPANGQLILAADVASHLGTDYWTNWATEAERCRTLTVLTLPCSPDLPSPLKQFARVIAFHCDTNRLMMTDNEEAFAFDTPTPLGAQAINTAAAITVARQSGLTHKQITLRLKTFPGLNSRLETIPVEHLPGLTLIDDFAHHPREIDAAISIARLRFPGRKLVALFEPHQYQRLEYFLDQFADSLAAADEICVTGLFCAREPDISAADAASLVEKLQTGIQKSGKPARLVSPGELNSLLNRTHQEQAVVLMMTAGKLRSDLKNVLSKK